MTAASITLTLALPAAANAGDRSDTARRLNTGLAGTPMARLGYVLYDEATREGIHPAFVAAAAGLESSYGRLACRGNRFNAWGLGSCNRAWQVPHFRSWRQAIRYYARFVATRWPHARTPYDLHGYCECGSSSWGSRVSWHMRRLGFAPVVIHPKGGSR